MGRFSHSFAVAIVTISTVVGSAQATTGKTTPRPQSPPQAATQPAVVYVHWRHPNGAWYRSAAYNRIDAAQNVVRQYHRAGMAAYVSGN